MKFVTTGIAIVFAAVSIWIWMELRETWKIYNSYVVQTEDSRLKQARILDEMLQEGRTEDALSHLQRNRDVFVLTLRDVREAIDKPSWRWKRNTWVVEMATEALQSEAEYRRTHGQSEGKLSDQVAKALEGF